MGSFEGLTLYLCIGFIVVFLLDLVLERLGVCFAKHHARVSSAIEEIERTQHGQLAREVCNGEGSAEPRDGSDEVCDEPSGHPWWLAVGSDQLPVQGAGQHPARSGQHAATGKGDG